MTGLVVMMVVITCDDKFSVIGEALGLKAIAHMPPAIIAPFAGKPFILGVGEQDLAMLRRPQYVDFSTASQPPRRRRYNAYDDPAAVREFHQATRCPS